MSERKYMKINRGRVLAAVVTVLVVALIITSLKRKSKGEVKDVVVEIQHMADGQNDLIKDKDVKEIIRRSFEENVMEARVGQLDVNRIERVLELDPFIENAETFIDADNILHVKIGQREPICRIIDNNSANYYLDKMGVKNAFIEIFFCARTYRDGCCATSCA
ncbi:MAG: hypothetical protein HC817_04070 [Saprospiraceae bacterium]|nr:hypothetical protein [Saprospiraceae bacterium]